MSDLRLTIADLLMAKERMIKNHEKVSLDIYNALMIKTELVVANKIHWVYERQRFEPIQKNT